MTSAPPATTWPTSCSSAELNRLYPDDDVRSEEGLEHVAGEGRLWIVDPLDGTREFRQLERSDWAVHVAMAVGGVAVVGAVALPALDLVLSTAEPPVLPPLDAGERPRVVVSRSRPPDVAYDVTEAIGGVMIPMGSAGAKIAAVDPRRGRGLRPCRRPVRVGLVRAGGGGRRRAACTPAASTAQPLRYGDPDAWLPDLVVCRQEYADGGARRSRRGSTGPTGEPRPEAARRRGPRLARRRRPRARRLVPESTEPRLAGDGVLSMRAVRRRQPMARTFAACRPLGPWLVSNSTFCPSSRLR